MAFLKIRRDRCTGCRTCELVCAFEHEGAFALALSRIQVRRRDVLQLEAKVCVHCVHPRCVLACEAGALIQRDGQVVFEPALCTGCGACVEVCDRLFWDPGQGQPLICDVCGACVRRCPEDALEIAERGQRRKE